jgi:hypothetical protein
VPDAAEVANQWESIKKYDGPVEFKATYEIVMKSDGKVDTDKSAVIFTQVYFTNEGKKATFPTFETDPIKITGVVLTEDKKSVRSFTFEGTEWYAKENAGAKQVVSNGVSGKIDLEKSTGNWTAQYILKDNGVNCIYDVTGKIQK